MQKCEYYSVDPQLINLVLKMVWLRANFQWFKFVNESLNRSIITDAYNEHSVHNTMPHHTMHRAGN